MIINEQILRKFFLGECSRQEAHQVIKYLKGNKDIIDILFEDEDWLIFLKENINYKVPYRETDLYNKIHLKLNRQISSYGIRKWRMKLIGWSVAACLLVALSFGILKCLTVGRYTKEKSILANVTTSTVLQKEDIWRNNGRIPEIRQLSDGSVVRLEIGSTLRYQSPFNSKKRLLYLDGRARFEVAKDTSRPFTVISGNLSTTALGTIFSVNNKLGNNRVSVQLIRGKVLVKNVKRPTTYIYLLPGERCDFDGSALKKYTSAALTKPAHSQGESSAVVEPPDTSYLLDTSKMTVTFRNAKLPVVYNVIEKLYGIKIDYKQVSARVMSNTLYSGSFDKLKMPAATVVQTISNVHGLITNRIDSFSYRIMPR